MVAAGGLGAAMRRGYARLTDRHIPLAGLAAAFIFALQMINFPVAAGTSGHLLGGALAAILLGPSMGMTVVAVVVLVQALLFADGGVSALGLNVFNMAIVTALSGWWAFRMMMAVVPKRRSGLVVATMVASWVSVVASAVAFVGEYAIGGQGGVDPGVVFAAMVGVHGLIGIGEGIITATVVASVLAVRPDLVTAATRTNLAVVDVKAPSGRSMAAFAAIGLAAAAALVIFVAPIASKSPDGLATVAAETGFAASAESPVWRGPFAGYGVAGVAPSGASTAVSGLVGIVATYAVGMIGMGAVRRRRSSSER